MNWEQATHCPDDGIFPVPQLQETLESCQEFAVSQAVQTAAELQAVHPTSVELQALQIPETCTYPGAHTQLPLLITLN